MDDENVVTFASGKERTQDEGIVYREGDVKENIYKVSKSLKLLVYVADTCARMSMEIMLDNVKTVSISQHWQFFML